MAEERAHVVVLPFAQQGHINPLMQLARTLASRGAEVTFVVSENTAAKASKGACTPNLRVVGLADGLPEERATGSCIMDSLDSMLNMEAGFDDFLRRLRPPVSALIYDAFMSWAPSIGLSFSIPCLCFFTSNAAAASLAYHVPALIRRGVLPFRPDGINNTPLPNVKVHGIEGVPELLPKEFPQDLTFDATHFQYKLATKIGEKVYEALPS